MEERMLFWTMVGAIGQWFAGVMTLAAVLYVLFHNHLKRPKLSLTFDKSRDISDQRNTVGAFAETIKLPPEIPSRWVRIGVKNHVRRNVARNCRASVTRLEKLGTNGRTVDVLPNPGRDLTWEHLLNGELARDIQSGGFRRVDLFGAVQNTNVVHVMCRPPWAFSDPGEYLVTVQVLADDADPQNIKLRIRWGGTWDSLVAEPA
jgi:sigma54-dependent transcription regulator